MSDTSKSQGLQNAQSILQGFKNIKQKSVLDINSMVIEEKKRERPYSACKEKPPNRNAEQFQLFIN